MGELKHVAHFRKKHLKPEESIRAWAEGYIGKMMGSGDDATHFGALIVTDQRVAFYRKGVFGEVLETIETGKITSIERKSTLGVHSMRLHTSHDQLEFKTIGLDAMKPVHDAIEGWRSKHAAGAPSAVGARLEATLHARRRAHAGARGFKQLKRGLYDAHASVDLDRQHHGRLASDHPAAHENRREQVGTCFRRGTRVRVDIDGVLS